MTGTSEPASPRGMWGLDATYLWVIGLSIGVAFLSGVIRSYDPSALWLPFGLEGTLVPAVAVVIGIRTRIPGMHLVRMALTATALGLGVFYLLSRGGDMAVPVLIVSALCCGVAMYEARHRKEPLFQYINPALTLLAVAASVAVAFSLIWWATPSDTLLTTVFTIAVFLITVYIVIVKLWGPQEGRSRIWWLARVVSVLGVAAMIFLAFRTDYLFSWQSEAFFHWSAYTGPADLVRQGGNLLWDVPSTYGFLSIQVVAWLPVGSSWEAMFLLNGLSNTVMAYLIFSVIRGQRRSVRNTTASLAITLAAVFLRNSGTVTYLGSNIYPSTGAYRFIWCLLLLALIFRAARRPLQPVSSRFLVAGSGIWLIGCLWSVESAVYCSIIWMPAFVWLARDSVWRSQHEHRWRQLGLWASLPIAAMALSIVLLEFIYAVTTGHGPDFLSYFEYALAYQTGTDTYPLDPGGPVWVLLLTLGLLIAAIVDAVRFRQSRSFVVAFAAAAGMWATSSYFVGRSHPFNVWGLAPVFCMAIFMVFHTWRSRGPGGRAITGLARLVAAPILIVLVASAFANQTALGGFSPLILGQPSVFSDDVHDDLLQVDALVPTATAIDPTLQAALDTAHVQAGDAIVYIPSSSVYVTPGATHESYAGSVMPAWTPVSDPTLSVRESPSWLPTDPFYDLLHLPVDRRLVYIDRFVAAHHMSGWMVKAANSGLQLDWLDTALAHDYAVTNTFHNGVWTVAWYQYVGSSGR